MNMRTCSLITCLACCALATGQVSASLVVNGDFEAGNTGFSSGYSYAPPASMYDPATYTIGTDPSLVHSAWTYGPHADHTYAGQPGVGHMMIVNGDENPNVVVWQGTLTQPLIQGQTYVFSAWVAGIYWQSPAVLAFSVGGSPIGTITPQSVGTWEYFSATFEAGADQTSVLINQNLAYSGNDFALDDISIAPIPEPGTVVAGTLLLLPFAASTVRRLRRVQQVR